MVLGEALVIGIVGGGLGTLMARGADRQHATDPGMPAAADARSIPTLMAGMFGFGALIGLLSGLAPAIGAYRANITSMLRQV